jgi:hypothetical protein
MKSTLSWDSKRSAVGLSLITLDGWERKPCHGKSQTAFQHDLKFPILPVKIIPASEFQNVLDVFPSCLAEARNDENKKQNGRKQSPDFIEAVFLDAVYLKEKPLRLQHQPRGGFGDVADKQTAWPLVLALLRFSLCRGLGDLHWHLRYHELLCMLQLWLLEGQLELLRPDTATSHNIDIIMTMLECAVNTMTELQTSCLQGPRKLNLDRGVDVAQFGASCRAISAKLENIAGKRAKSLARQFCLASNEIRCFTGAKPLALISPSPSPPGTAQLSMGGKREQLELNLDFFFFFWDANQFDFRTTAVVTL